LRGEKNLFKVIQLAVYIVGFLIIKIPVMLKMKKLAARNDHRDDPELHAIAKYWSRRVMKITGSKVEIIGAEHIPEGAVVMVGNHDSDLDIPVLLGFLEKPVAFVAKVEMKKIPLLSTWMEILRCSFMDRSSRRKAVESLKQSIEKVKNGHSLVIFPEGTRNLGGELLEFKAGALRLAKDGLAPIIPIVIEGTADIFEKNNKRIKPAHVIVKILPPIANEELQKRDMVELAGEIQQLVAEEREELRKLNAMKPPL